jgi:hypothetical protein
MHKCSNAGQKLDGIVNDIENFRRNVAHVGVGDLAVMILCHDRSVAVAASSG